MSSQTLTEQQQQQIMSTMLKKPQNALCADCNSKSPCWASLDFGVFVCMNCSGAHRSLGQHVTRIKSTKLDQWKKQWIWHMQLNNKIINEYYEHSKGAVMNRKPNPSSSLVDIKKYVYDKYVKKLFAKPNQDDPITNLKNGKYAAKNNETHSQGENQQQKQQKQEKVQKMPPKSVVNNQQQQTKNRNLLDQPTGSNKATTGANQNKKINDFITFDETHPVQPPQQQFNKDTFNSFSGNGAHHSSTNAQNSIKSNLIIDPFFAPQSHSHSAQKQKQKSINFDQFNAALTQQATYTNTNLQSHHPHYAHIPHQPHHPHSHYQTLNNNNTNLHPFYMPPQHNQHNQHNQIHHTTITVQQINTFNISLNDTGPQKQTNNNNLNMNMNDHLRLDLNDFKIEDNKSKKVEKVTNGGSWVDDWK